MNTVVQPNYRPLSTRLVNRTGSLARVAGLRLPSLDIDNLRRAASKAIRLDDFGTSEYELPLARLLESAEHDAKLSTLGRLTLREHIIAALKTRALLEELRKRTPEVLATPLNDPIILIGVPRSGTTLLHRLLSTNPGARPLKYWETRNPLPPFGRDRRREWARRQLTRIGRNAPGIAAKHATGPDDPEECSFLLDPTFFSGSFFVTAPVYGYMEWSFDHDIGNAYQTYRDLLAVFQAQDPKKRLVLKAPAHGLRIAELLQVIPNARLVQLFRDPLEAVVSVSSLLSSVHCSVTEEQDLDRLGQTNLRMIARGLQKHDAMRKHKPDVIAADVDYEELLHSPLDCVRRVCSAVDLDYSPAFQDSAAKYLSENPKDKYGPHEYLLSRFGLSAAVASQVLAGGRHFTEGSRLSGEG